MGTEFNSVPGLEVELGRGIQVVLRPAQKTGWVLVGAIPVGQRQRPQEIQRKQKESGATLIDVTGL